APSYFVARTVERDDILIAEDALGAESGWHDQGVVRTYEEAFSAWNGSAASFAFLGGREALSAILFALGITSGDVIVPGYTCIVVPNAVRFAGANPVFADIELETYGLSADSFMRAITPQTHAVVLQHLFGLACRDYEKILEIAAGKGIAVIEDCAH